MILLAPLTRMNRPPELPRPFLQQRQNALRLPSAMRGIDNRLMSQTLAMRMDLFGIVSRIHQVVERGDPLRGERRHRDCHLGVMQRSARQHGGDWDLTIGHV